MTEFNIGSQVSKLARFIYEPVITVIYKWVFRLLLENKRIRFSFGQIVSLFFWFLLYLVAFVIPPTSDMLEEYFTAYYFPNITFFCLFVLNIGLYIVPYDFIYNTRKIISSEDRSDTKHEDAVNQLKVDEFSTQNNSNDWLKDYYWSNALLLFIPLHVFLVLSYSLFVFQDGNYNFGEVFKIEDPKAWIFLIQVLVNLILCAKIFSKDLSTYKGSDLISDFSRSIKLLKNNQNEIQETSFTVLQDIKNQEGEIKDSVDKGLSLKNNELKKDKMKLSANIVSKMKGYLEEPISFTVFYIPFVITLLGIFYFKYIVNDLTQNWNTSINVLSIVLLLLCVYRYVIYFLFVFIREAVIAGLKFFSFNTSSISLMSSRLFVSVSGFLIVTFFLWFANANKFYRIEDQVQINIDTSGDFGRDSIAAVKIAESVHLEKLSIDEYFKYWVKNISKGEQIYLVAGEGGGSRAGLWTFQVLKELKKEVKNFHSNLFVISSVSGSSVGSSLYLNSLAKIPNHNQNYQCINQIDDASLDFFSSDFVTKPLLYYLGVEPFNLLFNSDNRNDILLENMNEKYTEFFLSKKSNECEESLKPNSYNGLFNTFTAADTISKDMSGEISTVFIANSFDINQSKPAVTSSVDLEVDNYIVDIGSKLKFPIQNDLAVNFSEMFPFLSASASINGMDGFVHHFYDGGVYDNYGLSSILPIYRKIRKIRNESFPAKRIVVVLIDNSPESNADETMQINNSFKSLYKAVSNSTFKSVPNSYRQIISDELKDNRNRDKLVELKFPQKVTLNRWLSEHTASMIRDTAMDLVCKERDSFLVPRDPIKSELSKKGKGCIIRFNAGKSELLSNYISIIEEAYIKYWSNSSKRIKIKGFADNSGDLEMNKKLANDRAKMVARYLIDKYPKLEVRFSRKKKGEVVSPTKEGQSESQFWKASQRKVEVFME